MFKRKKIQINAVLDTDIENLLKKTNQYENIVEGKVLCKNCQTIITPQNIGIINPNKSSDENVVLEFYCDKLECSQNFID